MVKNNPDALVSSFVQRLAHELPFSVAGQFAVDALSTHHAVFSNVPGPTHRVYFSGKPVDAMYPLFTNIVNQVR